MKRSLGYPVSSLLVVLTIHWLVLGGIARTMFFLSHASGFDFSWGIGDVALSYFWGSKMDLAFMAFAAIIPFIGILLPIPRRVQFWIAIIATDVFSILFVIVTVASCELYTYWHHPIDATIWPYFLFPNEMLASSQQISFLKIGIEILLFATFAMFSIRWAMRWFEHQHGFRQPFLTKLSAAVIGFVLLIIAGRGGIRLFQMSPSLVSFSVHAPLNHATFNPAWNLAYTTMNSLRTDFSIYQHFSDEEMERHFIEGMPPVGRGTNSLSSHVLTTRRPNVLIILWESFTSKALDRELVPERPTPQFEELKKGGLFFSKLYATGPRSEKGIVGVLSAMPAFPVTTATSYTDRMLTLPSLNRTMKEVGYSTAFYYGGDIEFANIKSYLVNTGIEQIVDRMSFAKSDWNSKWGAHDHVVLSRLFEDLQTAKSPFLTTLFTLSSHEPFEVPGPAKIPGDDLRAKFLNSLHYADHSVGEFVTKLMSSPVWNDLLVVIVADHGQNSIPGRDHSDHFHIPMLWTGGALKPEFRGREITKIVSQLDLSATLSNQLDLPASDFVFSRDMLSYSGPEFALYSYNHGFGMVTPTGHWTFDSPSRQTDVSMGDLNNQLLAIGKAFQQKSFEYFFKGFPR